MVARKLPPNSNKTAMRLRVVEERLDVQRALVANIEVQLQELLRTPVRPAQLELAAADVRPAHASAQKPPCGCHDNGGHTDPIADTPEAGDSPRIEALTGLRRPR